MMNRRMQPRPAEDTPEGIAQKHHRVLLHALHTAHPVKHDGKQRFIHTITFSTVSSKIEADVYLTGDGAKSVKAEDVQLWKETE